MHTPHKLELVSFKVCPFVQRSVIALNMKGIEYSLTHINPHDAPDWFKAISPLGKCRCCWSMVRHCSSLR